MNAEFDVIDVHMTDLLAKHVHLETFVGLAACGGFSYGDVLGAGRGQAESVINDSSLHKQFEDFFCSQGYINPRCFVTAVNS